MWDAALPLDSTVYIGFEFIRRMSQRRAFRVSFRANEHTSLSVRGGACEIFERFAMFCHFQVVKNLGKGAFGKVKLVQDTKDGKFYALKIMDKMVLKKKRQVRPEREVHAYRNITSSFQHIF